MKIKLKKFEKKYFFIYVWNLLNYKTLKSAGILEWKFIGSFFKKPKYRYGRQMILVDDKIVGGLDFVEREPSEFEVGIIIFKKHRDKGIAYAALVKLFKILKRYGAEKIIGINDKDNTYSIKLVRSLGYKKVGENEKEFFWEKKLK